MVVLSMMQLKETNFTRLCSSKSMLVVNDSLPGPVIRATKGDTVFVNVQNQGDYGVTIHWYPLLSPPKLKRISTDIPTQYTPI